VSQQRYFIKPNGLITINAPLILKVREEYFFSPAKHIKGHFERFFKGAETFLTAHLSTKCCEGQFK
jgi:hypothetical protein